MVDYPEVDNYFQEFEGMTADQNRAPELSPTLAAMIEHEHVQIPTQKPCTKTTTLGKNLCSIASKRYTVDKTGIQSELQVDQRHDQREADHHDHDGDDGQWELLKALQIPDYVRQQQRRERTARDVFQPLTVADIDEALDELH